MGVNVVPRLQTEKDRLGTIEENPMSTNTAGKGQAELGEDEPIASYTCTINDISPALGLNAELAFS